MSLRIARAYKDIGRYSQVLDVLGKRGFGMAIREIHAHAALPISKQLLKKKFPKELKLSGPERARKVLEELGPTFIKLGQVLATRPDLVPSEYIEEFEKLQDEAPKVSFSEVRKIVESELDGELDELFASFERVPIASASIGQVHIATLEDGSQVAVKIQRPGIKEVIQSDVDIMKDLARLAERYIPEARVVRPTRIVQEFEKTIKREMNYLSEGRNVERMRKTAEKFDFIHLPDIHWDKTTQKVLTMEYLEGDELKNWLKGEIPEDERKEIGRRLSKFIMTQILVDGFFQADPHPANFVVMEENEIGVIDLGMVGFIDDRMRNNLLNLFIALMESDCEAVVSVFLDIGSPSETSSMREFRYDLEYLVTQYNNIELKQVSLAEMIGELEYLIMQYHIRVPPNFTLFLKALTQMESILRTIYPDFNTIETVSPIIEAEFRKMSRPEKVVQRAGKKILELQRSLTHIPSKVNEVLDQARKGRLHIQFEHQGLSETVRKFDRMTDKLVFSLVISSIILASAIVMHLPAGPQLLGFSALGLVGYLLAASLGFWLVVMMFTSGRL